MNTSCRGPIINEMMQAGLKHFNKFQVMTNTNIRACRKIRTRIEHLGSKLRLSYSAAQQHQNDQTSRDGAVRDVVHLYKQLRRSERSLELLRAEDVAQKTAAAALRSETAAEKALAT